MSCYCAKCEKYFHNLGITRHRVMHRDKKERVEIQYSNGTIWEHDYRDKNENVSTGTKTYAKGQPCEN